MPGCLKHSQLCWIVNPPPLQAGLKRSFICLTGNNLAGKAMCFIYTYMQCAWKYVCIYRFFYFLYYFNLIICCCFLFCRGHHNKQTLVRFGSCFKPCALLDATWAWACSLCDTDHWATGIHYFFIYLLIYPFIYCLLGVGAVVWAVSLLSIAFYVKNVSVTNRGRYIFAPAWDYLKQKKHKHVGPRRGAAERM